MQWWEWLGGLILLSSKLKNKPFLAQIFLSNHFYHHCLGIDEARGPPCRSDPLRDSAFVLHKRLKVARAGFKTIFKAFLKWKFCLFLRTAWDFFSQVCKLRTEFQSAILSPASKNSRVSWHNIWLYSTYTEASSYESVFCSHFYASLCSTAFLGWFNSSVHLEWYQESEVG